jgi:hypothetical protein
MLVRRTSLAQRQPAARSGGTPPNHPKGRPMPSNTSYKLNTNFGKDDLKILHDTNSNVVVAKPTLGSDPSIAWVVFRPFENNSMSWLEQYGIYASNVEPVNGAILTQMSKTGYPAQDRSLYPFTSDGSFGDRVPGGAAGSYYTKNEYINEHKVLTFGLFQEAVVNGEKTSSAISAAPVMHNYKATMTPYTTVFLWVQSDVESNTVVTSVTSAQTEVKFGGGITEISLTYEDGIFIPKSGIALADGVAVNHRVPVVL